MNYAEATAIMNSGEGRKHLVFLRSGAMRELITTCQAVAIQTPENLALPEDERQVKFNLTISRKDKVEAQYESEFYHVVLKHGADYCRFTPENFFTATRLVMNDTSSPRWHRYFNAVKLLKHVALEAGYADAVKLVNDMEHPVMAYVVGSHEMKAIEQEMMGIGRFNKAEEEGQSPSLNIVPPEAPAGAPDPDCTE